MNLVKMFGGRCPENPYHGFYQKTGQCLIDAVSMALIYGGKTSDSIINIITQRQPNYIETRMRTHPYMIPINIESDDYPYFIKYANISQIVLAHDAEDESEFIYDYQRNKIREHFKRLSRFIHWNFMSCSIY